jgi:hypothetical protein
MAGLVPAIHVFLWIKDVDARDKPGHDVFVVAVYRIAIGLIMLCTPPLNRGWPSTNMNS